MTLALSEAARPNFPAQYTSYYQEIYTVPLQQNGNLFINMMLNQSVLREIFAKKVALATMVPLTLALSVQRQH